MPSYMRVCAEPGALAVCVSDVIASDGGGTCGDDDGVLGLK